jgi:hypothetical protein
MALKREIKKMLREIHIEMGKLFTEIVKKHIHPDCCLEYILVVPDVGDTITIARARCPDGEYEVITSKEKLPRATIKKVS